MMQVVINIITILAFVIAIFTWFGIKPKRLQKIAGKYFFKNWPIALAIVVTFIETILVVFLAREGSPHWWPYIEAFGGSLFFWLISISYIKKERQTHILDISIIITPVIFLSTSFGRVYDAFNGGAMPFLSPSTDKWMALGISAFYIFLFGFNLGMGIFTFRFGKGVEKIKEKLVKTQETLVKTQETLDKVETLMDVLEMDSRKSKPNVD